MNDENVYSDQHTPYVRDVPEGEEIHLVTYDVTSDNESYIMLGFEIKEDMIKDYISKRGIETMGLLSDTERVMNLETGLSTTIRQHPINPRLSIITFLEEKLQTGTTKYQIPKNYYKLKGIDGILGLKIFLQEFEPEPL